MMSMRVDNIRSPTNPSHLVDPSSTLFPSSFSPKFPSTERPLMPLTIPTGPDEETPLLGGRQVSDVRSISEQDSEAATLAGPSNRGSRTSSIKGKANANLAPEVVKKTPVPWAQFSIVMFLQLAEPLTSQVIYPVSSAPPLSFPAPLTPLLSLRPRSVCGSCREPTN
jgi:hypothetical protein